MHPVLEQFTLAATKSPASRAAPLMADLDVLGRFRRKMADNALAVNVAQMVFDRGYALERIAMAHTTADPSLRRMAVRLFTHYTHKHLPVH